MTETMFFFGTLRDPDLLERVLGRRDYPALFPARLPDYRVRGVKGAGFPMIEAAPGALADGLALTGLTEEDRARLDFYEGAFGYRPYDVLLEGGTPALVYLPEPGQFSPAGDWSLFEWQRAEGPLSRAAAAEAMGFFGRKTAAEVGAMFHMIRSRAASGLRARDSLHGARAFAGEAHLDDRVTVYAKHFALDEFKVRHSRYDGSMSPPIDRAVFRPPDATLVLPYDPVRDRVLLVEQVRMGPLIRGDRQCWLLEPIAGHIDAGETPQEAARREASEEAGLTLEALLPVCESYASPGGSAEFYYIFAALADLPDGVAGTGGLDAEHEDIRSHLVSFHDLMMLCDRMEIANAPLLIAAYWLARHRSRLRDRLPDARSA